MTLETGLVKEAGMDCTEMEYASASKFLGRNYELMFIDAWGFELADQIKLNYSKFTQEELRENFRGVIGNRLSTGNIEVEKYLESYHGVRVSFVHETENTKVMEGIKSQIDKGFPVGMWFDQHYMEWTKEIRKNGPLRYAGRLMIHGYNDRNRLFQCIDIHGRLEGQVMSYDTFLEFLNSRDNFTYDTFTVDRQEEIPSVKVFLEHTIDKVLGKQPGHPNMMGQMKQFAEYVAQSLDMEKEILVSQGPLTMPNTPTHIYFIRNFVRIARMRNMYALAVEYMANLYNDKRLHEIGSQFRVFNANWHQLVAILTKAFFRSRYNGLGVKLHNQIMDFAKEEEEMLKQMMNLVEQGTGGAEKNNSVANIRATDINIQLNMADKKLEHVPFELKNYFDNRAVMVSGRQKEMDAQADFDGIGDYYVFEKENPLKIAYVDEVPFQLNFDSKDNDNLICNGQLLLLGGNSYDFVSIVGACDSGPFFGVLEVEYEDGTRDKITYGFGEWRFPMCEFKENVLITSDRFYNNIIHPEERGYMFYKTLPLQGEKGIKRIQLPKCMNMHLFAITFSRIVKE